MSKFFQAMQRSAPTTVARQSISTQVLRATENVAEQGPAANATVALVDRGDPVGDLVRAPSLCRLSEQLAALGTAENPVRLLVSGCRAGDGASTIAAALAIDLSQRLAVRTVLVEGHLRHPALRNLLARSAPLAGSDLASATVPGSQRTGWPRLDLIPRTPIDLTKPALDDLDGLLRRFPIAVIDLGVIRLEPRMLVLARPSDPILIVTRYQHTERQELLTTAAVLRATNHTVSGVVLNGHKSPVPAWVRHCLGFGG
jgi:Mrp family chromosome partitioning ATPase